jgi:hypothetical protein
MALTEIPIELSSTPGIVDNSNATAITIDSSENVGIGTASLNAANKLEVTGDINTTWASGVSRFIGMRFGDGSTYEMGLVAKETPELQVYAKHGSGAPITFLTGATPSERLRIDASGNVGIGISPAHKLSIFGTGAGNATVQIEGEGGADPYINFLTNNAQHWSLGVDDSDADKFKLSEHSALGTNDYLTVDVTGNVGINTAPSAWSSSSTALQIGSLALEDFAVSGANASNILNNAFRNSAGNFVYKETDFASGYGQYDGEHRFNVAASGTAGNDISFTRAMTIAASAIVLIGTTDSTLYNNTSGGGINLFPNGSIHCAKQSTTTTDPAMLVNNTGENGDILQLRKDGAVVGKLANTNAYFFISGGSVSGTHAGLRFIDRSSIRPCTATGGNLDNIIDLGNTAARFDDIYATNGTIQTSDRNEKQDIAELSDAEQRVAVAAKGLLRKFRWKNSVAEKGDEARTHFGIIAQDLQSAFEAEGLDADDYAMFINSTWTDEETGEERSRMGVRYSELLAFIIAAI